MSSNRKALATLLIGLFFGIGIGYLIATPPPPDHDHPTAPAHLK